MTKEEIQKLKEIELEARKNRMNAEEEYRVKELVPFLKTQIGKCFKFRNGYSADDKWWLYAKILDVEDADFKVERFQTDTNGEIRIEYRDEYNYQGSRFDDDDWIEITLEEYNAEKKKLIDNLIMCKFIETYE